MSMTTDAIQLQLPTINRNEIIAYQGIPVVTTRMLADYYGVATDNIRVNFNSNKDRFKEGKHYFRIIGQELKDFRLSVSESYAQIGAKGRIAYLWTQRGAARHAKMINTDRAWEVFERLEDAYFEQYAKDLYKEASRRAREAKAEWQRTRQIGKDDARKPLTDAVQGLYLMYTRQKGEPLQSDAKFYMNYTNLAYFAAFDNYVMNKKLPDDFRDHLTQAELKQLALMETRIRLLVNRQTGMDTPYKSAYQVIKTDIDEYANSHGRVTCSALPAMLEPAQ